MSDLEKRIAAIEARLNMQRTKDGMPPFRVLRIEGGLPGPINWAYAGKHRWERDADAGEELEAFVQRAARAAMAAGETSINIGGLPRSDELARYKTFEELWAAIGVDYPEVPPCEPAGSTRRW
ncbi:hypothetical protein [Bradyrhizobium sp. RT11b]|uniref:hypothetical protein n=1 Tax=Bradyrhizobium sp. RT11b TaxID=3156332 RepID=UPI00339A6B51